MTVWSCLRVILRYDPQEDRPWVSAHPPSSKPRQHGHAQRQCQQPTLAFLLPGAWPSALFTQNPTDPGDHVWDSQCGQRKSGWSASVSNLRLTKGWLQSQYSPYRTRVAEHICLRLTSSGWSKKACWVGDISSVVQEEALCPLETQQSSPLVQSCSRQLVGSAVQRR